MLELTQNKQVKNIQKLLLQPSLSPNDCSRLMIELREFSEMQGKTNYPMINFYGDLSVHPKLDRKVASSILVKIEDNFGVLESLQSTNDLIAKLFSMETLLKEILSFQSLIPEIDIFSNREFWKEFLGTFFSTIVEKPLIQSDPSSQIESFYFKEARIDKNGQAHISNPLVFLWVIKLRNKGIKITGHLYTA